MHWVLAMRFQVGEIIKNKFYPHTAGKIVEVHENWYMVEDRTGNIAIITQKFACYVTPSQDIRMDCE